MPCVLPASMRSGSRARPDSKAPIIPSDLLDGHGRAVGQHFRNAVHYFVGIVPHVDDGIGAVLLRMFHHQVISVLARSLAKLGVDGDVSAEQRLEAACNIAKYAA